MPPTNSSSTSVATTGGANQDKQLLEARSAIKADSLLMKKALVGNFFLNLGLNNFIFKKKTSNLKKRTK